MSSNHHCVPLSSGTRTSFLSGYRREGSDNSLILRIINKTLIFKDYTEILQGPGQEELNAFMRGAFDGKIVRNFGNIGEVIYPPPGSGFTHCWFTVIAAVTNEIHKYTNTQLGERFLKFQLGASDNDSDIIRRSMQSVFYSPRLEKDLHGVQLRQESVGAYLNQELDPAKDLPPVPDWYLTRLINLSHVLAVLRANISRKGHRELHYRPEEEFPARIARQLTKLSQTLAFVLNKDKIDREIYQIICRVALDTSQGWQREIVEYMAHQTTYVTKTQICDDLTMGRSTCSRALETLKELYVIRSIPNFQATERDGTKIGRPDHGYRLTRKFSKTWNGARINYSKLDRIMKDY